MVMSLQEVSDRMEINNLMIDYCTAVDSFNIDDFDNIFTSDAHIDYTELGGAKGSLPEIKDYLKQVMPIFPAKQHLIANSRVYIDGDTATARTMCHNPMRWDKPDGDGHVMFYGLWYVDKLQRTAQGWRISERVEEFGYAHNVPEEFQALADGS